jgi:hypothetical protein
LNLDRVRTLPSLASSFDGSRDVGEEVWAKRSRWEYLKYQLLFASAGFHGLARYSTSLLMFN